ncbi:MAG: tRNA (guanosine(37)-N1)-methyltransferase TrmD [Proteobacteria bacterium]|nr:tRNA (guanosine(37)-N1)-methyltransferase TrmD [Pseudomonadota bacterium]
MRFSVVTLFPELFRSWLESALLGKAVAAGRIEVRLIDPRAFAHDRHHTVDDTPYGGGEGMVLKVEPFVAAIEAAAEALPAVAAHRVLLSPQGARLTQARLHSFALQPHLLLVCGRYEGFDERIRASVEEELSLGDFVLNGGEVAAMAVIDGVSRLLPGVIGNRASLQTESHAAGLLEYPQYTRPREYGGLAVPEVLLSGDHERIRRWRRQQMLLRTRARRADLWRAFSPDAEDRALLAEARLPATPGPVSIALLHHPVYDRDGQVVTTALTNLDLHDIARSARTYGLERYFVATPLTSQQELVQRILGHWRTGHGANTHASRAEALARVEVAADLDAVIAAISARAGRPPLVVATTAARRPGQLDEAALRRRWEPGQPLLLLLGTGWGLTQALLDRADAVLLPLGGPGEYNHLSVRSAAAILLDRLFGLRQEHGPPAQR